MGGAKYKKKTFIYVSLYNMLKEQSIIRQNLFIFSGSTENKRYIQMSDVTGRNIMKGCLLIRFLIIYFAFIYEVIISTFLTGKNGNKKSQRAC